MRNTTSIILTLLILVACNKEGYIASALYGGIVAGDSVSDGIVYINIQDTALENECDYIGC
jgi:hypothetical protein